MALEPRQPSGASRVHRRGAQGGTLLGPERRAAASPLRARGRRRPTGSTNARYRAWKSERHARARSPSERFSGGVRRVSRPRPSRSRSRWRCPRSKHWTRLFASWGTGLGPSSCAQRWRRSWCSPARIGPLGCWWGEPAHQTGVVALLGATTALGGTPDDRQCPTSDGRTSWRRSLIRSHNTATAASAQQRGSSMSGATISLPAGAGSAVRAASSSRCSTDVTQADTNRNVRFTRGP
jgi:hypothetical protein